MKKKTSLWISAALVAVLCAAVLLLVNNKPGQAEADAEIDTWEAYQALSPEEREAFYSQFVSAEAFEAWLESVKPDEATLPAFVWDKAGKLPDAYTWDEYQALSLEEQEAFYQWFQSEAAFEEWMEAAKAAEEETVVMSWNKSGKLPNEYTWEEYLTLKSEEKEAFFLWFGSESDFEAWKDSVKPTEPATPVLQWDKSGKQPSEYTWEEYQALNPEEQEAFFRWFGSVAAFEAWMKSVNPQESVPPVIGWNKPGKQPNAYTWEEYQALTIEEQEAFYWWFGSATSFEAWMNSVKADEEVTVDTSWNKPGKKPDEYTWVEYQSLSPEEQDAFFNWFGSVEAFEAWMKSVKGNEGASADTSWNKPGKKPSEYTWEEYQALSPEDQERFYHWFASLDAFEAWMESARSDINAVWSKPGKLPDQYTKEEYLALNQQEQEAFFQWFETLEAFEAWVKKAENP